MLEIKGEDNEKNRAKRAALTTWVDAINTKGGFGSWCFDVAFEMATIQAILQRRGFRPRHRRRA